MWAVGKAIWAPHTGANLPVMVHGFQRRWSACGSQVGFSTTYLAAEPAPEAKMAAALYRLLRQDPDVVLLDARPHDMYTGEVIRHSIMGGHIPGAVNIVSLDGTDGQSGQWRDDATLAALSAELPKDKRIYVDCHDGFRMSLAYLQLKHLGFEDVRLYNGGWSPWGNTLTLPVVEGAEPLGGDFAL